MKPRQHRGWVRVRAIANWVNMSTPLGLVLANLGRAEVRPGPERLWLAEYYALGFPKAGAFTVGNVVLIPGRTIDSLASSCPEVLEHEAGHATQWALCMGLPFLPLYLLANAISWARTGTLHSANIFEIGADLAKGGYTRADVRPFWRRLSAR